MSITLPTEIVWILHRLRSQGFEAYIAGGAVRDLLLHSAQQQRSITDFDCTTNALPEQIQQLFPDHFYENTFGTVTVMQKHIRKQLGLAPLSATPAIQKGERIIDTAAATKIHSSLITHSEKNIPESHELEPSGQKYEITTFRSDEVYGTDRRKPTSMSWGTTLEEDVTRRDFTINALALSISDQFLEQTTWHTEDIILTDEQYRILDFVGGQADLAAGIIRSVGDAHQRFSEDALRMLRALRFSVQLNFAIDETTYRALQKQAELLQAISAERIRDEFFKMLASAYPKEAILLLDDTGLLSAILPELLEGKGVQQGGHHTTDVWTHSLEALASCPSSDPLVRFATLIHDIGKPRTFKLMHGKPTFYNHEVVGAHMAKTICRRLNLSKAQTDRVFILVRHHMFHYQPDHTDAAIRRFMRKVGLEYVDDILDLREGDRLGSGARRTSWRLEEMKQRMIMQLHQPMSVTDLAIDGNDLMQHLELKPGPILGTLLKELFEMVLENPELNTKEILLQKAREISISNKRT